MYILKNVICNSIKKKELAACDTAYKKFKSLTYSVPNPIFAKKDILKRELKFFLKFKKNFKEKPTLMHISRDAGWLYVLDGYAYFDSSDFIRVAYKNCTTPKKHYEDSELETIAQINKYDKKGLAPFRKLFKHFKDIFKYEHVDSTLYRILLGGLKAIDDDITDIKKISEPFRWENFIILFPQSIEAYVNQDGILKVYDPFRMTIIIYDEKIKIHHYITNSKNEIVNLSDTYTSEQLEKYLNGPYYYDDHKELAINDIHERKIKIKNLFNII